MIFECGQFVLSRRNDVAGTSKQSCIIHEIQHFFKHFVAAGKIFHEHSVQSLKKTELQLRITQTHGPRNGIVIVPCVIVHLKCGKMHSPWTLSQGISFSSSPNNFINRVSLVARITDRVSAFLIISPRGTSFWQAMDLTSEWNVEKVWHVKESPGIL